MTVPHPLSPLDRAFFTLVARGWDRELIIHTKLYSLSIRVAIVFTIVVFIMLPLLYFWTEKAA